MAERASTDAKLALSAFLDSSQAAALPPEAATRALAGAFLDACYRDLGKVPRLLEDHDVEAMLHELLPARLRRGDPRAEHADAVLAALLEHLEETAVVPNAWELRRALEEHAPAFHAAVAAGTHAGTRGPRPTTVEHRADKLGRNDPCWCGSGRKFKKCCGANA